MKLLEQANQEAEHNNFCSLELHENQMTRDEKTAKVESLTAERDRLEASLAKLAQDIADLNKAISDLDAAMAEATKLRAEENKKNLLTIDDAKTGQVALAQAMTVLKEFYAKGDERTAFVQTKIPEEQPAFADEPFKGMAAEGTGIIGILELVQSDYAHVESDVTAEEATALREYEQFITDSKSDKQSKGIDIDHKQQKTQDDEGALAFTKEDLEGTQKELDAALRYFDKLKPSCIYEGPSYEEQAATRQSEIEALRHALTFFKDGDYDREADYLPR